ncbi:DUF3489 domain-containing protein [Propionivibrio dicarboxylicus]|uniref:DUF3489 domain-containing protein n=1 Tax=Propionivibrio dicarboxylicus TaxID=83767 RepID=A0A1G7Z5V1_9RHOO|nr:Protein of unknown function [Propionivibrio dicarboxylicus]
MATSTRKSSPTKQPAPSPKQKATVSRKKVVKSTSASPSSTIPLLGTPGSKQSRLLALLQSSNGATLAQMADTTGWQAHSIRGCISAVFRKRLGLNVQCSPSDTGRVYRIIAAS